MKREASLLPWKLLESQDHAFHPPHCPPTFFKVFPISSRNYESLTGKGHVFPTQKVLGRTKVLKQPLWAEWQWPTCPDSTTVTSLSGDDVVPSHYWDMPVFQGGQGDLTQSLF